jgi:ABC-2 type transport system ATP-binding protein
MFRACCDGEHPAAALPVPVSSRSEWRCRTAAIEVRGLCKRYGDVDAVDGVDLSIAAGEVFALLGPNGAGKTTTVEILEGHRPRTSGEVSVLGTDPEYSGREFRERIGVVLQNEAIEKELTVNEVLNLYGRMYPTRRPAQELVDMVGLHQKATSRIKTLSGGQRRRLELALGLVGDPELLFLDEPTTGFDPSARRQAWTVIDNLRSLGKTILLTTHYMDEAQNLSDRVAVIAKGRIVAEGSPATLGGRATASSVVSFHPSGPLQLPPGIDAVAAEDGALTIRTDDPTRLLHTLTGWALDHDLRLDGLSVSRPSLEDIYLELTGEPSE